MTKTQKALLASADSRGQFTITSCHGRGPDGGRVNSPNTRRRNAATFLCQVGILELVRIDKERTTRNGFTLFYSTAAYRLTVKETNP